MGRRSEHTPDVLRALVVEEARKIVAVDGLSGLSAREIARRIGYSPGTLYNIFANLDDLILHIEAGVLDQLDQRLANLPATRSPTANLLHLAQEYLAFTSECPRLWNLLFEHHLPAHTPVPEWYQVKLDALLQRVERALQPLMPFATPELTQRSARVLWAGVHGITSLATAEKLSSVTSASAKDLVTDLVENYLAGLATRRPEPVWAPPQSAAL